MRPSQLADTLHRIISHELAISVMIWGAPGVGKSSIVRQAAERHGLALTDLRLSQLAPTDLRGLPVPEDGRTRWYPPEFLPREGRGVLFLDEINMAPPSLQGIAQQLVLDRHVGEYRLPDGWFVWAAGNLKEHRAAVHDMPAPLANRFLHLEVEADLEDFRSWGYQRGIDSGLLAFLSFRPELLHRYAAGQLAWPSPRSWEMADALLKASLDPAPAVGLAAATELLAFREVAAGLPDFAPILAGRSRPPFPEEPSLRYATVVGLAAHADSPGKVLQALRWLSGSAPAEWVQLFAIDAFPLLRSRGQMGKFQGLAAKEPELRDFLTDFVALVG